MPFFGKGEKGVRAKKREEAGAASRRKTDVLRRGSPRRSGETSSTSASCGGVLHGAKRGASASQRRRGGESSRTATEGEASGESWAVGRPAALCDAWARRSGSEHPYDSSNDVQKFFLLLRGKRAHHFFQRCGVGMRARIRFAEEFRRRAFQNGGYLFYSPETGSGVRSGRARREPCPDGRQAQPDSFPKSGGVRRCSPRARRQGAENFFPAFPSLQSFC